MHQLEWLNMAVEIESLLEGVSKREQTAIINAYAAKRDKHVNTIRRTITNYALARRLASEFGLHLHELKAPMSSLETLARMERLSPVDAMSITRSALLGQNPLRDTDVAMPSSSEDRSGPSDRSEGEV